MFFKTVVIGLDTQHTEADTVAAAALVPHLRDVAASLGPEAPAEGLKRLAAREHADLLVLGPATDTPEGRIRIGETCREVLHGTPCPVLVPPRGYADHPAPRPRRIGLAYDGSPEAERILRYATTLVATVDACLEVVQVVDLSGFPDLPGRSHAESIAAFIRPAQERLDAAVAGLGVPVQARVAEGAVQEVLGELAARVDLLVCGSRSWGAATKITLGGVAERLMQRATCPVLVVPRDSAQPLACHTGSRRADERTAAVSLA